MELKKDEAMENQVTEQTIGFEDNMSDLKEDEPYVIRDMTTVSESGTSKKGLAIAGILLIVIAVVATTAVYINIHKYDGKYVATAASLYGTEYKLELVESLAGIDIVAEIEIKGKKCHIILDMAGMNANGDAQIEFDGEVFTLKSKVNDSTLSGKYDKDRKALILNSQGVDLIFEKQ